MKRRLLVIGLDGYAPPLGERLMREGRMPALSALSQRAAHVALDHGPALLTGLAWEHFSTGLDPAAAGRWSAVDFDPIRYACRQANSTLTPFPARLDLQTVVFDVPYFDLSQAPDVAGLVSWGAHDPGTAPAAHPASLRGELESRFGVYPASEWIYGFTWPSPERTREMGAALAQAAHTRARAAAWLLGERLPDWSLGIVVVSELHSAIEALWHGVDETHPLHRLPSAAPARHGLEGTFEAVDALVGSLVREQGDAAVLVVSMHGMGRNEADVPAMALLPELLYRRQFGRTALRASGDAGADGFPLLDERAAWSKHVKGMFERRRTPRSLRSRLAVLRRSPGASGSGESLSWMPAAWYARDWPHMEAFALPAFYDGQIRVNLAGRESRGLVSPARYPDVCKRLEEDLQACIDPRTGRAAVREVIATSPGDPHALGSTQADLTVLFEGSPLALLHPRLGTVGPLPFRRPGGHTGGHGVAWLAGPDVVPGSYGLRSAFDVVPTIVDYLTDPMASVEERAPGRSDAAAGSFSGSSFWPDVSNPRRA